MTKKSNNNADDSKCQNLPGNSPTENLCIECTSSKVTIGKDDLENKTVSNSPMTQELVEKTTQPESSESQSKTAVQKPNASIDEKNEVAEISDIDQRNDKSSVAPNSAYSGLENKEQKHSPAFKTKPIIETQTEALSRFVSKEMAKQKTKPIRAQKQNKPTCQLRNTFQLRKFIYELSNKSNPNGLMQHTRPLPKKCGFK